MTTGERPNAGTSSNTPATSAIPIGRLRGYEQPDRDDAADHDRDLDDRAEPDGWRPAEDA